MNTVSQSGCGKLVVRMMEFEKYVFSSRMSELKKLLMNRKILHQLFSLNCLITESHLLGANTCLNRSIKVWSQLLKSLNWTTTSSGTKGSLILPMDFLWIPLWECYHSHTVKLIKEELELYLKSSLIRNQSLKM